jgi:hypothetical protein
MIGRGVGIVRDGSRKKLRPEKKHQVFVPLLLAPQQAAISCRPGIELLSNRALTRRPFRNTGCGIGAALPFIDAGESAFDPSNAGGEGDALEATKSRWSLRTFAGDLTLRSLTELTKELARGHLMPELDGITAPTVLSGKGFAHYAPVRWLRPLAH